MKVPSAYVLFILLLANLSALGQVVPPNAPIPPGYEPPPPSIHLPSYPSRSPAPKIDLAALQRDARELLDLSQSVQPDIDSLQRGLLPKDLLNKLKRIEKLSKHVRSEVAPLGN
jgi:hypothetical protein